MPIEQEIQSFLASSNLSASTLQQNLLPILSKLFESDQDLTLKNVQLLIDPFLQESLGIVTSRGFLNEFISKAKSAVDANPELHSKLQLVLESTLQRLQSRATAFEEQVFPVSSPICDRSAINQQSDRFPKSAKFWLTSVSPMKNMLKPLSTCKVFRSIPDIGKWLMTTSFKSTFELLDFSSKTKTL
jgi:hypothetical protein